LSSAKSTKTHCFHCGSRCFAGDFTSVEKVFCCQGCLAVFKLLSDNGLSDFYTLDTRAGVRAAASAHTFRFEYLDEAAVRERLVSFSNERVTCVVLRLPAIHCIACVWLLENLFKLNPGIGRSEVDFLRREATIRFEPARIKLSELVSLLASIGYEPDLKLADIEPDANERKSAVIPKKLWMQLGVAGFAFGNNMLFSIASYFGLDAFHSAAVSQLVGYISMALAVPVLLYSAQDYFQLAWTGLKHRMLTIEVPIVLGILVIFTQSSYEVLTGHGGGYFDSFAGLLFFLLSGRLFQQKTYGQLAFDRDFKSFFPLAVTRKQGEIERSVALSELNPGDCLLIRNGELIPADSKLISGHAQIDYSFVTGESEVLEKSAGDHIYAGGRQVGSTIEIETRKEVSQSYLTSLWNQDIFTKPISDSFDTLINRYSQRFTKVVLVIALGAAAYWLAQDSSLAVKAFTSVLIVACPCALALSAPFTLGTAIRILGRSHIYLKSPQVLERLAQIDTIVFDKTGTLTATGAASIEFNGPALSREEKHWVHSVTRHSTHPYAVRISKTAGSGDIPLEVRSFLEIAGCGIQCTVAGHEIALGSRHWLGLSEADRGGNFDGSVVHLVVDGIHRGTFGLRSSLRPDVEQLVSELSRYELAVLSGDNERERAGFEKLFGKTCDLAFNQSPAAKLAYIRHRQLEGGKVMMVGDGLNDSGALKQSDVGVAVVEGIGAFSPASDIVIDASCLWQLGDLLRFSRTSVNVVRLSFAISTLYNLFGLAIAASGHLAPIVCAILMPLSSISVVVFACLATTTCGYKAGLTVSNSKC
jgi:Cu+-exporting ATPase